MDFKESLIQNFDKSSNFDEDILNPFLDQSKLKYPNHIIESNSDMIQITLLKRFPKPSYDFKYENALKSIENFLKQIISDYGLSELNFHEKLAKGFNPSFKIKVPLSISSKDLINYSDDIFKRVEEFANSKNIDFILDDLSIILSR